jgi:hypothetical protein
MSRGGLNGALQRIDGSDSSVMCRVTGSKGRGGRPHRRPSVGRLLRAKTLGATPSLGITSVSVPRFVCCLESRSAAAEPRDPCASFRLTCGAAHLTPVEVVSRGWGRETLARSRLWPS